MVGNSTIHFIDMFVDEAPIVPFLTSYFRSPPKNYFTAEKVSIDIVRDTEEIAVAIQDLSAGTRENELAYYQNKGFTPPVYDESATLTSFEMQKRLPGQDVFQDPDYVEQATEQAFMIMNKLQAKIRRAVEQQCAQVLTKGKVDLLDKAGRSVYAIDYGPRSSHFPTAGTAWGSNGYDPLQDIGNLGDLIRSHGRGVPKDLIFGRRAFKDFISNQAVKDLFNIRRFDFGTIGPSQRVGGGSFKGRLNVDAYDYDLYVYDGTYVDPQSGNVVPYIGQDQVVMLSENARLDLVFGNIPLLRQPQAPALTFLPPRISNGDARIDLTVNAWFTPDGKHLKLETGTRPLAIPTAIDTFGCLTTR